MPELPIYLKELKTKRKPYEHKIGPLHGVAWLSRIEDAYTARTRFNTLISRYNIAKYSLLKHFGLTHQEISTARIEDSKDTPAVNIFVYTRPELKGPRGSSTEIKLKGIGRLYVNVVFTEDTFNTTIAHEEEHTRLFLKRLSSKKIITQEDAKEQVIAEMISEISAFFGESKGGPMSGFFFSVWLPKYIDTVLDYTFEELIENNKDTQYPIRPNLIESNKQFLKYQTINILKKIVQYLDFNRLTPQEIVSTMRQNRFDEIEKALDELNKTKYKYTKRRRNKE